MGKIKKLLESELIGGNNQVEIYPVTSSKAVFNSENKDLDTVLLEKDGKIAELGAEISGIKIDVTDFTVGQWSGDNPPTANSNSGYLRCSSPYNIDIATNGIIKLLNTSNEEVRIADYGLTIKFTDADNNKVTQTYEESGKYIKVGDNAKYMYIHSLEGTINSVNGFNLLGLYSKPITSYVNRISDDVSNANNKIGEVSDKVEMLTETKQIEYLPTSTLKVFEDYVYVGSSLLNNPQANSTNSALEVIDVSGIEDDTVIYIIDSLGKNSFNGWTFKFFGADNNQISTSVGGSTGTNDRGYRKPNGAVKLGLHYSNSRIEGNKTEFLKSLRIYNIPYVNESIYKQVNSLKEEIATISDEISKNSSYKETVKILFIGSSFGVDTVREVGNICSSFNKDIIIGNAYIGASTLGGFLSRWESEQGVTYYKWKYQATDWEQYNGTTGKWSSEPNSDITDEGEPAPANDTVMMDWILSDEAWDFIILQNGAYQSPYPDQSVFWEKGEDGNITKNIVQELIDKCKKACLYSNPVFGMNMTWAFSVYHTISESHGPNGANDDKWLDYGSNQKERQIGMWTNIAKNYKDCITNCPDVKFVIPSGTAVQNARTNTALRNSTIYTSATPTPPTVEQAEAITSLEGIDSTYPFMNNDVNWKNKTDFTRDSIHADFGITRYIIAGTLFQTFISKVYNLDIENCKYRISLSGGDYREQLCTAVTDDNISLINKCIKEACKKPFEISNI